MNYLLGLDIGTSSVKGVLVNEKAELVLTGSSEQDLSNPRPGWAEQDPEIWWESTVEVIKNILNQMEISSENIAGISLSGQMHSAVFLDRDMKVIRPAILWSDTRTSSQCQEIYERVGGLENLLENVGNPALEGFTAPKILWLKQNEPENYRRTDCLLLPKDYLRFRLTGEAAMEYSDAAGTLLLDIESKEWSHQILEKLEITPEIMPPLMSSIDVGGEIRPEVADKLGLAEGTPVIAGGADNACGAVGSGIIKTGRSMVSIGSSGVVLAHTDEPEPDEEGRIHLFNHARPNSWYMMGVMLSAGMSMSWIKESMYDEEYNYDEINRMASEVEPGSEGLIFLPYLYGERTPHADADARGVFFGLSARHDQSHFFRSVMEGVCFGIRDSLELIKARDIELEEVRVIGGGARSKVWQQILADVLNEEISLINVEEGPAFGAALIAGVGTEVFADFEEACSKALSVVDRVKPDPEAVKKYEKYYSLYKSLYPSLKDRFADLSEI
ncbi:xylulokinase [Halarsenatibacter silvermanii]|uniref:Xylulose kinase n=1 Tax=Halarsenatibacter silvermanii TaxID=321763 RepID=A0A1G9KN86_9FIRM|nr:xylulokinase [Halarsenatibacter silvermanii]SDL50917.1 xylulokinase [Halarsenatibacter silvermanii]